MWKNIPNADGYQASSEGEIRSKDREVSHFKGEGRRALKGKVLKKTVSNTGYYYVSISINGKPKKSLVHRLVCAAFFGESDLLVNHKDGNKKNNSVENIEWSTPAQNNKHAYDTGLKATPKTSYSGKGHATFKSPIEATNADSGNSFFLYGAKDIRDHGFQSQTVYACCLGKVKKHRGYTFRRVEDAL